ncbi:acyl-CoA ligase (AMP-forming), exosortase A system-associated [Aliidongia dinghuensis]|uniref:Acyl-CoA ligase (AMP-forming), exosortase A system-associated n=1 Tax=Aliidongia dinghuensis TaxID=1867774 RepID=A0A8J2YRS6_9PROT|nr:acyl-CoA ligase (AMP-forming), exosortase A system-associated [Aliidongia dinghuensis]GGF10843.1 acyl-CoA ligase (AMP-forming), exosortase A system-associated [Aliidongia dinghuensis]
MTRLAADLLLSAADRHGHATALVDASTTLDYGELAQRVDGIARGLVALGTARRDRVAVFLEKRWETVGSLIGAMRAGCVMVPINPTLKARQVRHVLRDGGVRVFVTSRSRLAALGPILDDCPALKALVLVPDGSSEAPAVPARIDKAAIETIEWHELARQDGPALHRTIDADMAAIFYTSGSTGLPKGVAFSHRNLVAGAESVNAYLGNGPEDRLLAALPLSFDAGFSQLTTGFAAGARIVLLNYLLPRDLVRAIAEAGITGLTGVPPLFAQLVKSDWPAAAGASLRYFANTGGHMPRAVLDRMRRAAPRARIFLMYGLTEAFRSTYLPPDEIDRRPDSIGKAIPNNEILVVDEEGAPCPPGQVGELVHRGATVAMGYWNDPEQTAMRFRPAPKGDAAAPPGERAVWSGDLVRQDEEGFLYFVGRRDDMIKTSGYRVSPTEIEEIAYGFPGVAEVAAVGLPDEVLGHTIALAVAPAAPDLPPDTAALLDRFRGEVPSHMVPRRIFVLPSLPHGPNGKIDRGAVRTWLMSAPAEIAAEVAS